MSLRPPVPPLLLGVALVSSLLVRDAHAGPHPTLPPPSNQPEKQPSAGALLRAIERLAVVGNVLYIAAHPDDENTRMLSYLVGECHLRAAYLSLTRGDGGQNLIGPEQGPLLGLIRTQELLAARRIDGAEQWFTRARDFGYSKTPTETLHIWDREQVLADVVWAIRRFRPDVILTRFSPQPSDTHGHHTASALLAQEAFAAAADPSFAPEQVRRIGTWKTQRIYWNRSVWAGRPADDLATLPRLDIGGYDPLRGASYGEIAAESRSMHKSQGFGAAPTRGQTFEYFQPLSVEKWATPSKGGPLNGLDFTWARVPGTTRLRQLLDQAQKSFHPRAPEASVPILLQIRSELSQLPENPWKLPKLAEINELLIACAGLFVEASASEYAVAQGGSLRVRIAAQNRSPLPLQLKEVHLPNTAPQRIESELVAGRPVEIEQTLTVPVSTPVSAPYWLREPPQPGLYPVPDPALIGLPESPAPFTTELVFAIGPNHDPLIVQRPVLYKWTDPIAGERHRSIEITPSVLVQVDSQVLLFTDAQPRLLRVRVTSSSERVQGTLQLELPTGYTAQPSQHTLSLDKKGMEKEFLFSLRGPASPQTQTSTLRVVSDIAGQRSSLGIQHIDYPHIPIQTLFPSADVKLVRLDVKKTRTRIGYIPGAGDDVAAALRQVGYDVTVLNSEALEKQDLTPTRYSAVVVGVRAYNTHPRLAANHQRLMDYVAAGGMLLAQYNTNNWLAKLSAPMGPYPFQISHDRVTDENAAMSIDPKHPLWQKPNRLQEADLAGWVQERGLYFAGSWDERYETPFSLNDPGESAKKGSVLIARHGKGFFVYTGLAFFRQLPAGIPGAFRLFANLLDYGSR